MRPAASRGRLRSRAARRPMPFFDGAIQFLGFDARDKYESL
jgi:hypothetical protein